ncbi:hypothetical protein [Nannocystis sp. SCPEA4]|uniref:hypothetical protein n=1 Tax=Nannocystis sp. SCPEA4 TaxID=2996787 RepID=UPI00227051F8|nr:hypothetical protein [Nannocystis sp. SCPEA4]MCY1057943.1 hypothetical protein [Nannocystis sp. SCPEA4]
MKLRTLIALGAVSLGLFGYTLCQLSGREGARERPAEVAEASKKKPWDKPPPLPRSDIDVRDDRDALAVSLRSRLERALEAPEELPPLPIPDDRREAETAFEVVMSKIEGLADKGNRLSKRGRKRLYRAANDAFAALSDHLDAQNPQDLAALEEAHVRLKVMLREIDAQPPGS